MDRKRPAYPSDLTEAQWQRVETMLPPPASTGQPREVPYREIVDAVLYVLRSGCAWCLLSHDFPSWKTVYSNFRTWRLQVL